MKFHSIVIFVKDIEKSKIFYTKLLNQKIKYDFGINITFESGFSIWELASEHIISKKLDIKTHSNKLELYFEDENIESTYRLLKKSDIKFLHEVHIEPWGQRTIRFFDCDNHLIEVGEPLHTFVNNMDNSGMSEIEVSQKSGIDIKVQTKINKL